jgi:type I restriction enzyme M protein
MTVTFLNPRTCGIYKDGGTRYKTDPKTGRRTTEIDNQLIEHVDAYLSGEMATGTAQVDLEAVFNKQVLAPTYYDERYNSGIESLLRDEKLEGVTLGELLEKRIISGRGGHGSPGNDQRSGHIPYVKVSDIRGLRINTNPTNLVTESVARRFWRGASSGLQAWDLITPNRASSNIGEFALLLPGEEQIVLTKEVFVFRVIDTKLFDQFYLLWALSLKVVRDQWRRIALMQTNREDCGARYREIIIPKPKNKGWGEKTSNPFREYFSTIANAKAEFISSVNSDKYEYVANVVSAMSPSSEAEVIDESSPESPIAIE